MVAGGERMVAGMNAVVETNSRWLTQDDGPRIGAELVFARDALTLGGTAFKEGERAIVSRFEVDVHGAKVTVRTPDGRMFATFTNDAFEV